jgi:hypothetical protein
VPNRRDHGSLSRNRPRIVCQQFTSFEKKTLLHMVRRALSSCAPNSILSGRLTCGALQGPCDVDIHRIPSDRLTCGALQGPFEVDMHSVLSGRLICGALQGPCDVDIHSILSGRLTCGVLQGPCDVDIHSILSGRLTCGPLGVPVMSTYTVSCHCQVG